MTQNKKYVIGVDYGTDSCRAIVVDTANGQEISTSVSHYKRWSKGMFCNSAENRYRQHPLDYIESMESAISGAISAVSSEIVANIKGISFDTTGSTPVLTDRNGTPLALLPEFAENPDAMFVLWKDHTAVEEAAMINNLVKQWEVDYTAFEGGIYSSEWAWAKVLHIFRTNPEIANAAYSWMEHCDWITALVTGNTKPEFILRSRCAAGHKAMWHQSWGLPSEAFLAKLHPDLATMRSHLFTETHTGDTVAGVVSEEWANRLGLPSGVVVSVGALDAHIGAVGSGAAPHILTRIIGTSTCDIMIVDSEKFTTKCIDGICGQVDGSVLPGHVGIEAGQSAFGDIYAWFKDVLAWPIKHILPAGEHSDAAIDAIIPELMKAAEQITPSESGIVALDWLNGRRTPYADQSVKGSMMGLTLSSSAPMIFRALVESTAFGSKAIVDHLKAQGVEIKAINATGGISHKAPLVMQILADVLNMPIQVVQSQQTCALGAAMYAAVAAKIHPSIEVAQSVMGSGFIAEYHPNAQNHEIYLKLYEKYVKLQQASK